jgi:predicted P-loop ATPase
MMAADEDMESSDDAPRVPVLPATLAPPRAPLFNVQGLATGVKKPVLFVETEAAARAAIDHLKGYTALAAPELSARYRDLNCPLDFTAEYDLKPLTDRDVLIWPTADTDGLIFAAQFARHVHRVASRVRIFDTSERSDGWNIVAALQEGWDTPKILAWGKEHVRTVDPSPTEHRTIDAVKTPKSEKTEKPRKTRSSKIINLAGKLDPESDYPAGSPPASAIGMWQHLGLAADTKEVPHPTLGNVSLILQRHEAFADKFWLDTFRGRIYHSLRGEPEELQDADLRTITVFIQQQLQLPKFTSGLVFEGLQHAAEQRACNPLTDWLDSLQWDGINRLETWLSDTLGAEQTVYTQAVARNWIIAMVARAYKPGCKADHMPVLEGLQGLRKSTFLEVLGGEWYEAITTEIGSKAFLEDIQGVWLAEIPDMSGFAGRREHGQVIAAITVQRDRYRNSYGRVSQAHERGCIFVATSENDNYLTDLRGHRRFWPIRCTAIDIDSLKAQRAQIFAEGVAQFKKGATWYDMPAEAAAEQLQRAEDDEWTRPVLDYAYAAEQRAAGGKAILYVSDVLTDVLQIDLKDQSQHERVRIARILQSRGWRQTKHKQLRAWFKLPHVEFEGE